MIKPPEITIGKAQLSSLTQQLDLLLDEEEADEYGMLRPTQFAYDTACGILIDTATALAAEGLMLPYGCASTDSEGGVRIEWNCSSSSVRLVVSSSAQKQAYVYHEVGNEYGTEAATPESLAHWLRSTK